MKPIVKPIALGPAVEALLADSGLPVSDLAAQPALHLLGARLNGKLVGVVGIEAYENVGLLRSLAVAGDFRHGGYGRALVAHAENLASQLGIQALYLLTTTAASFFARQGYEPVPRSTAPQAITKTAQFAGLCPASSVFMRKQPAAHNPLKPVMRQ